MIFFFFFRAYRFGVSNRPQCWPFLSMFLFLSIYISLDRCLFSWIFPSLVHISDLFSRCSGFFPPLVRTDDLFSLSSPRPGHHRVQEGLRAAGRRGDGGAALWRRLAHVEAGRGTHGGGWRPCVWWVEGVVLGHVVCLLIHPSIYLSHHTQYLHNNNDTFFHSEGWHWRRHLSFYLCTLLSIYVPPHALQHLHQLNNTDTSSFSCMSPSFYSFIFLSIYFVTHNTEITIRNKAMIQRT